MADLNNLTASEVTAILPPAEVTLGPDDLVAARGARIAHFDTEILRLRDTTALFDAWRGRLDFFVPPRQPQTLQQLVEAARHQLRRDRLTTDRLVLDRQILLIDTVRAEVAR